MFPLLGRPLILYFLLVYAQPSKGEWNVKNYCSSEDQIAKGRSLGIKCARVSLLDINIDGFSSAKLFFYTLHDCILL